ncbi:uncharacterized protein EAE97_001551 [Botrytis byssoidea]|uniref:Uncharacterized protein n=1 Tax=Botrytis byssoidea TaxID=139641 RepID=A0A9P5M7T5_9HELO|nr:uncharacterized protein EAE97_001551 [Botrytis byssoidea]KAF7952054.1 hypothetical protein EAE97_001551 [Botrytis byssoidea]
MSAAASRTIRIPELETQDLDIGGLDSPEPSLSPGDTVEPSVDTNIRDIEKHQAARKKFGKNNKGRDSEAGHGDSHRPRRRRSHRKEEPMKIDVRFEDIGPSTDEIVTTTLTTFHGLPFSLEKRKVQTTQFKRSSHGGEDHKKPSGSNRIPTGTDRGLHQNREEGDSDRMTKHSSQKGSVSSQEKSERKPKSATSSRHDAPTHRSARDNSEQVPRAGSRHSSNSSNSQNTHKVFGDEPSPGGPKALSEGPAGGSLNGRPPRSNTGASGRHSSSGRDLQNKYQPIRGPLPNHEQEEHTQIGYGRNDKNNEPYALEIGKHDHKSSGSIHSKASTPTPSGSIHSKASTRTSSGSIHSKASTSSPPESIHSKVSTPTPSGSIHSKASTRTSSGSIRSKVSTPTPPESTHSKVSSIPPPPEDERTQIFRGKVAKEDDSSAYMIERYLSNTSASGSGKYGGRRASTRNSIAPSHYTASEQAPSSLGGESESGRGRRAHR